MRLFLLFSFMLLSMFSFAQIEIIEDFTGYTNVPGTWYHSGFNDDNGTLSCDGVSLYANLTSGQPLKSLATPYQSGASNGTTLSISYDFKVVNFSFFEGVFPVEDGWGTIDVEYTTDSTNWTTIETISDANYTSTVSCTNRSYTIDAATVPAGVGFQMRLVAHFGQGGWYFIVDNFSITQVAQTAPNCDAMLTSPANGATEVELDASVSWANATGLPTGYKISIGSTMGGTDIADNVDVGNVNTYTPTMALEYSTVYYVTITSYNSFGNATDCTEQSFTTRNPPLPGSNCEAPIVITEFPFNDNNTNAGYDNDYNVSPCNNTYVSGFDVVYAYTPTEEASINVRFDNIVGNRAAIHVLDGCPDVAENCLAYYGAFNTPPQYFENLILEANHTYYIVIASSLESAIFTYHLEVTKNSCVIPDATFTSVEDCENGQYYVDVDITRMGSAETLTIADDQMSETQQVDTLGIATFGPYPTGTPVHFTVTNDQDDYCVITGSTEFHCNDFCFAAYPILTNPDLNCTNYGSSSLAEAGVSVDDISPCSQAVARDVWFTFVATNEIHTIEIYNVQAVIGSSTAMYFEVLEGTCGGGLTSLLCSNYTYNNINGLTVGNTYYIRAYNSSGAHAPRFDICVSTPQDSPANDICSQALELPVSTDNACNNMITGTTISAVQSGDNTCSGNYNDVWYAFTPANTGYYTFELAVTAGNATTHMSYWSGECGALTVESSCSETPAMTKYAHAGETTYVMVRSIQGKPGVDFTLCAYPVYPPANNECTTPVVFAESVDASGNNLIIDNNATASNSTNACYPNTYEGLWYTFTPNYTGEYKFNFAKISGGTVYYAVYEGACDDLTYVSGISSCYNSTEKTINVVAGHSYIVSVHSATPAIYKFFVYPVHQPPSNDNCATADILTESTDGMCENAVSGNTHSANSSSNNDCGAGDYDVWYSFTPANSGYYQFDLTKTAGDAGASMALYSGTCGALTLQSVNCSNTSMIEGVEAGVTYTVVVKSESNNGTATGVEFDLCAYQVTPPANNDCAAAEMFMESADNTGENTVSGANDFATYSAEACYGTTYEGVWYAFTPAYTGQYTFEFTTVSGDASYSVYSGACGEFAAVTADCYNTEASSFEVIAGNTYTVSVQSEAAAAYEFFVYPDFVAPANNDCGAAAELTASSDENCENMVSGTTLGAGHSDANTCSDGDFDVWYNFIPASDGYFQFDLTQTSGTATSYMALFSGDCGAFTMISEECNTTSMIQQLTGGTVYTLMVASDTTTMGVDFDLCAYQYFPPANNDCIAAQSFTESVDSTGNNLVTGTNEGAFNSPEACYDETFEGVWYTFTTAFTGTYVFDFTSLTGNASYTIYSGDCEALEFAPGIEDCYLTDNASVVAEAGTTFIVSVHSEEAATYEFFVYPTEIVGTEDLTATKGLKYFPNPVSSDRLNITADANMSTITVFNTLGQRVMTVNPESMTHIVNMAHLQAGIYFVKVTIDGAEQTVKVIKE